MPVRVNARWNRPHRSRRLAPWCRPRALHDHDVVAVDRSNFAALAAGVSASVLGFPAITLRESIERPAALDSGAIVMTGLIADDVVDAIGLQLSRNHEDRVLPAGYEIADTSARVARFILSTPRRHATWAGLQ